jgi:DHA1 family bicyclomycin/chloramphenicol resistance-like MFS transporter
MVWLLLPETLRHRAPEPVSPLSILRSYRTFLRHAGFLVHLAIAACCMAGLFSWISTSAFVLQDIYGLTAMAFGLSFAVGSSGYMLGTLIAARFVTRWGSDRTMGYGTAAMAAGGLAMPLFVTLDWHVAFGIVAAIGIYLAGMGLTLPQAQAGALLPFPERAGAASSLFGATIQTLSAGLGAILGHILGTTAWPLAIAMAAAGLLALVLWRMTRAQRRF